MVACVMMSCGIAVFTQLIKKVQYVRRVPSVDAETLEQIALGLVWVVVQTGARRHELRQCLTELSKGDQGSDGIIREIALAARGKPLQLWITLSQKAEIG
jgi:hypothetical protein